MKKLMNKKGFTLIEMLVVIAIIAVLVAIIVPTVTSATKKANAATDAANLRSVMAEANIYVLSNDVDISGSTAVDLTDHVQDVACKSDEGELKVEGKDGVVTAYFGTHDVDYYANIAGGEKSTDSTESTQTPTNPGQ